MSRLPDENFRKSYYLMKILEKVIIGGGGGGVGCYCPLHFFRVNALCKFGHRKLLIKISRKPLQLVASDLVS